MNNITKHTIVKIKKNIMKITIILKVVELITRPFFLMGTKSNVLAQTMYYIAFGDFGDK